MHHTATAQRYIDCRDPDLSGHHRRTEQLTAIHMAARGAGRDDIEVMAQAARVHDIGKLCIPDGLLNKPSTLGAAEYKIIKEHPQMGHELLEGLELDHRILNVVLYHHENWDGSGYPAGLVQTAIPLEARLMRIWDSYDSMRQTRPYKLGVSHEEAIKRFRREPRFYDPDLLDEFCGLSIDMDYGT